MNEDAGESGGSPRERLARIRTLLNGVFSTSDSERPQAWVDMMHGVLTIPPSAVLSTYEYGMWQAFLSYDPPSANHGDVNDLTALGWLTTTFHQAHASFLWHPLEPTWPTRMRVRLFIWEVTSDVDTF